MFDIGFLELLLLSVVGLLVLGPERLPRVARTIGSYIGKARRTWTHVRMEIEREIAAEEIKRSVQEPLDSIQRELTDPVNEIDALRRSTEQAFTRPAGDGPAARESSAVIEGDKTAPPVTQKPERNEQLG